MEWVLDIVLIFLLGLTLYHALRLERALGVLKRDRAALEDLVRGFNHATGQAEAGVDRLRAAAEGAGRAVSRQVEAATALKDDLGFLIGRGEKLADQIDGLVRTGRGTLERMAAVAEPPRAMPAEASVADLPRLRSQAERDLAQALRLGAR